MWQKIFYLDSWLLLLKRRRSISSIVLLLLLHAVTVAQNIPFVPPSFNYNTAGNQNWAIAQGKNGVIYVGNNDGLLSFDAVNWKLHRLPNNLAVKSILVDNSSGEERIYVGSFEEFGYFRHDEANQLHYHSLQALVQDYTFRNDEIWTIHKLKDNVFFQSFSSYFVYNETASSIEPVRPYPAPLYFFTAGSSLYAQFIDEHFYVFDGKEFQLLLTKDKFNNDYIVSVFPYEDQLLLISSRNGIFRFDPFSQQLTQWKTGIDRELGTEIVNRATVLSDSIFFLGTLNNGVYALDTEGNALWHLNRNNGLNNNTCLGLFMDRENNLWAALDNGISYIQTNSPLSFFEPKDIQLGLVEEILVHDNQMYLASNHGIYSYSEVHGNFYPLPDLNIQSWFIRDFDDQIITGNNRGVAFIENDGKISIPEGIAGGTDIKRTRLHGKELLLGSTYNDLIVYLKNSQGKWEFSHKIDRFSDLINNIEIDHTGNIWAGHMYRGLYRLRLSEDLTQITEQDFYLQLDSTIKSSNPVRVMELKGRIVFADGHQFYTYDDIARKIIPYEQLNTELHSLGDTRNIVTVNDSTFWFVRDNEYTIVRQNSGSRYAIQEKILFSGLNNAPNSGRGNIYLDQNGISYFCLNGGIGKYNFSHSVKEQPHHLEMARVWSYNRKDGIAQNLSLLQENIISYTENNIAFEFQYTDFSKNRFTVLCYLKNYDSRWTATSSELKITYTNLPANTYMLEAKVVNDMGEVLSTFTFPFEIKNPWYKTSWAYFFYVLSGLFIFFFLIKIYIQIIVKRKNRLFIRQEKERLLQLERQEKLITQLINERLENELVYKSKELANASMLIINHQEFLNALKKDIQDTVKSGKIQWKEGMGLVKLIDSHTSGEDVWTVFQENFDLIHENFFRKLKERYPQLTPSDLRLCALLRLNYSSKDIANMLNLTLRGVEAARYRLRKKLSLQEEENLVDFMINFH